MKKIIPAAILALASTCAAAQAAPGKTPAAHTPQYDLNIKLLPDSRRAEVSGTWRLPPGAEERRQIEFYLSSKMEKLEVRLLEPQASAPLTLSSSAAEGRDTKWVFKPAAPVPAGQPVRLQFSYVSDGKPAPQFNISAEGSFAGGGGELWYPQTSFSDRETGTLRFRVPAGETVISNGKLQSAAGQRANGEFVFHVNQPSKFGFASGKYTVVRRPGGVPFALYLLRPSAHAEEILSGSAGALNFLTGLFGPFPYQEFSFVEVDFGGKVRGTGEFGFILADVSEFRRGFDLSYWAHELGHQWWGNLVRSRSGTTGRMMLSEGITQFGALRAVEAIEGASAAERFRRSGYQTSGTGQSAASYFRLVAAGKDLPLTAYEPKSQNDILSMHALANSKGFILLDMLSRRIGHERFASILKNFIREKANQTTSWQDLQRAVEAGAGQDVRWFFEQWFERTGAPDYQLSWRVEGGRVRGSITQAAPHYRAALEVEIKGSGRSLLRTVEIDGERAAFDWPVPFKVESVILDPHYKTLRWTPEHRSQTTAGSN